MAANICFALVALHKFSQIENENERKLKFSALSPPLSFPTLLLLCFIIIPLWAAHLAVLIRQSLQIPQFRMPARLRARERIHLARLTLPTSTALKINLISLPMGSVLWKHKKSERVREGEVKRSGERNDEDLQSGKTRNGNKNHIFTGAWRLRRTSHLSTRRESVSETAEREREEEECVGRNGVKSASWHAKPNRTEARRGNATKCIVAWSKQTQLCVFY